MADVPQMGPGNPYGFDLSQLLRMLQSQGPVNLDVARQVASVIATIDPETGQARPEPSVEADVQATFGELARAAQSAVADFTGIAQTLAVPSRCVGRGDWATATLEGLAPVLESLARALGATNGPATSAMQHPSVRESRDEAQGEAFFGMLMQTLLPVLLGVWAGSMIGQLSHQALGQYDLPFPLEEPPTLLFVARNVDEFADAWQLPADELRYALTLREAVHGAQRCVPWVRERLVRLSGAYVGAYELRPDAFEQHLGEIDLMRPETLESIGSFGDPGALLGAMRSERQEPHLEALQRFVSVLEGYADVTVETLGARMVPSHGRIDEALRRHRLERGDAAAFVDRLLGLELARSHYEEGAAFCRGVVERAGHDGLNRLWEREELVPTRAELEAPGLWLARIELVDG